MGKVRFGEITDKKEAVQVEQSTSISIAPMTVTKQVLRDSRARLHSKMISSRLKSLKKAVSEIKTVEKQTVVEIRTIETPTIVENKFNDESLRQEISQLNVALAKAQDETCKLKSYIKQLEISVSDTMHNVQKEIDVLTEADMLPQHTVTEKIVHHNNAAILYTTIGLLIINLLLMVVAK